MNKNVKKIFSSALTASMAAGVVSAIPANAATMTVGQLYAAAYNAVVAAKASGTQTDINTARIAIDALQGTGAEFAVGEFSKQVDGVRTTNIS